MTVYLSGRDCKVQRLPEDGAGQRGGGEIHLHQITTSTNLPPPPDHHLHQITTSTRSPAHILHLEIAWLQVDSTFPDSPPPPASAAPWFGRGAGSLPHLNRPCLVHNLEHGLVHNGAASHACPTHGHRGHGGVGPPPPPPANGCLPGQNSKYSNFSPERVIWDLVRHTVCGSWTLTLKHKMFSPPYDDMKSVGVNLSLWNFLSGQVRRILDT